MAVRIVPIALGGREFKLRMDFGAIAALEDAGFEIDDVMKSFAAGKISAKRVVVLCWAMLQDAEFNPTPPSQKEVGRWITFHNAPDVIAKVTEAWQLASPERPKDPPADPPLGAGTGETSSALALVSSA